MELQRSSANSCPVCGQTTKENESMIYCDNCGFNIKKHEDDKAPTSC